MPPKSRHLVGHRPAAKAAPRAKPKAVPKGKAKAQPRRGRLRRPAIAAEREEAPLGGSISLLEGPLEGLLGLNSVLWKGKCRESEVVFVGKAVGIEVKPEGTFRSRLQGPKARVSYVISVVWPRLLSS